MSAVGGFKGVYAPGYRPPVVVDPLVTGSSKSRERVSYVPLSECLHPQPIQGFWRLDQIDGEGVEFEWLVKACRSCYGCYRFDSQREYRRIVAYAEWYLNRLVDAGTRIPLYDSLLAEYEALLGAVSLGDRARRKYLLNQVVEIADLRQRFAQFEGVVDGDLDLFARSHIRELCFTTKSPVPPGAQRRWYNMEGEYSVARFAIERGRLVERMTDDLNRSVGRGAWAGYWKCEPQANGRLHVHLLFFGVPKDWWVWDGPDARGRKRELMDWELSIQYGGEATRLAREMWNHPFWGVSDARRVTSFEEGLKGAIEYVAKEFGTAHLAGLDAKASEIAIDGFLFDELKGRRTHRFRCLGLFHGLSQEEGVDFYDRVPLFTDIRFPPDPPDVADVAVVKREPYEYELARVLVGAQDIYRVRSADRQQVVRLLSQVRRHDRCSFELNKQLEAEFMANWVHVPRSRWNREQVVAAAGLTGKFQALSIARGYTSSHIWKLLRSSGYVLRDRQRLRHAIGDLQ